MFEYPHWKQPAMNGSESEANNAVLQAIFGSAPERSAEIEQLWRNYSPRFLEAGDRPGFLLEGGPFEMILFNSRTMFQIWILGFAAQQAFLDYGGLIFIGGIFGRFPTEDVIEVRPENCNVLIQAVLDLGKIEQMRDFRWPSNIPHPKHGKPKNLYGMMTFDLLVMAAAYVFLHEVEHIRIGSPSEGRLSPREEELACDTFAREILLARIEDYARESGYALEILTTKRAMSIALASFLLLVITPPSLWGGSDSHPPVLERIQALTHSLALPPSDHFWIYLSSLLIAHLRFRGVNLPHIESVAAKDICLQLLDRIPRDR